MRIITTIIIFSTLFLTGCCDCPEPDYTGWKRVQNPFYRDQPDSIWTYVEDQDIWIGSWDSTIFRFRVKGFEITDTLSFNKIKE